MEVWLEDTTWHLYLVHTDTHALYTRMYTLRKKNPVSNVKQIHFPQRRQACCVRFFYSYSGSKDKFQTQLCSAFLLPPNHPGKDMSSEINELCDHKWTPFSSAIFITWWALLLLFWSSNHLCKMAWNVLVSGFSVKEAHSPVVTSRPTINLLLLAFPFFLGTTVQMELLFSLQCCWFTGR